MLVKPSLADPLLRTKLAKGMGHNTYGEIAWPNDLLYMFPVCILACFSISTAFALLVPTELSEPEDPFATPLEILPEWFLLPTFELLRAIPNKIIGIVGMASVPILLMAIPFIETVNPFANPWRRPISSSAFIAGHIVSLTLGWYSLLPVV